MQEILKTLNEDQIKAVLHQSGPAVVLAGAGSGKTRVLTSRVAWLIKEKNINPNNILLVTFTNKAAGEMGQRVEKLTGFRLPFSGTFHSICARILRQKGQHLGLSSNYSIFDSNDQLSLIKQIYKDNNFNVKKFKINAIRSMISEAKNELMTPHDYAEIASNDFQEFAAKVYKLYQAELLKQNALDFDDLLNMTVKLLLEKQSVASSYQQQFEHVLVDEYQDTNKAQYLLTKILALPQNNLYVVGDFSQSIYAWRGADYKNLSYLKSDFEKIAEYRLERNYRSTQTILSAATAVIKKNTSHPILDLWTDNNTNEAIEVYENYNREEEAIKIASLIKENSQYKLADFAILYRTNAQSRPFEEVFIRERIPYKIVGGLKFYERKEIKDVLSYLRIIVNPHDEVNKERAQGLGKRRFNSFLELVKLEKEQFNNYTPAILLQKILDSTGYLEKFKPKVEEDKERIENIKELLNTASNFKNTIQFLENVSLVQDNQLKDMPIIDDQGSVTLMSLHSSKGLEFPVVFMVGMEEETLPHVNSLFDKEKVEEERRLCYVGITRAKEKLFFTFARQRFNYGQMSYASKSRFICDIPSDLLRENLLEEKSNFDYQSKIEKYFQNKPTTPKRRIVINDDDLDALLNDEMDIKAFLDS